MAGTFTHDSTPGADPKQVIPLDSADGLRPAASVATCSSSWASRGSIRLDRVGRNASATRLALASQRVEIHEVPANAWTDCQHNLRRAPSPIPARAAPDARAA